MKKVGKKDVMEVICSNEGGSMISYLGQIQTSGVHDKIKYYQLCQTPLKAKHHTILHILLNS